MPVDAEDRDRSRCGFGGFLSGKGSAGGGRGWVVDMSPMKRLFFGFLKPPYLKTVFKLDYYENKTNPSSPPIFLFKLLTHTEWDVFQSENGTQLEGQVKAELDTMDG